MTYYNLGIIYIELCSKKQAIKHLSNALSLARKYIRDGELRQLIENNLLMAQRISSEKPTSLLPPSIPLKPTKIPKFLEKSLKDNKSSPPFIDRNVKEALQTKKHEIERMLELS